MQSHAPAPYQPCHCSIRSKQQGGGGFAINLGAEAKTPRIEGEGHLGLFRAAIHDEQHPERELSTGKRRFRRECGAALWLFDPAWPDLVHPFASAVDTELPKPPSRVHIMLKYKASWAEPEAGEGDAVFQLYPEESIADWHRRQGLWQA